MLISGLSFGALATSSFSNHSSQTINSVIVEQTPVVTTKEFFEQPNIDNKEKEENTVSSYINYSNEKIKDVIRIYATLESCQFQNSQKDEFIYYLSEYVTSSVQAEKFKSEDLKQEYISTAKSFQPPHPTDDDCIDVYNEAKETVNYWNEKKNSAFNELFSSAKNRYSPDLEENIDFIQEYVQLPKQKENTDSVYSLTSGTNKKLPWNIKTSDIFSDNNLTSKKSLNNIKDKKTNNNLSSQTQIIPDNAKNINKLAIIDDNKHDDN